MSSVLFYFHYVDFINPSNIKEKKVFCLLEVCIDKILVLKTNGDYFLMESLHSTELKTHCLLKIVFALLRENPTYENKSL